ncbi:uncharacterized protein MAM_05204 [Metarhizium album ARSEF 1941]|uniref:Uncharacterized protein n=1 Tax=Metarhizium album (strain ARSEF 1941) TaxID=1081103 RepID=A0A0B2WW07_METAS|nr:uncharacterized protein MAM_05204 [Metarhizium album ARSEF 1941]KHN97095.1 hypothetical protein MAM_05204 [Metarhizium album ARSEF 1941]
MSNKLAPLIPLAVKVAESIAAEMVKDGDKAARTGGSSRVGRVLLEAGRSYAESKTKTETETGRKAPSQTRKGAPPSSGKGGAAGTRARTGAKEANSAPQQRASTSEEKAWQSLGLVLEAGVTVLTALEAKQEGAQGAPSRRAK